MFTRKVYRYTMSMDEKFKVTIKTVTYKDSYIKSLCEYINDKETGKSTRVCKKPIDMNLPESLLIADYQMPTQNDDIFEFSDQIENKTATILVNGDYIPSKSSKQYTYGDTATMLDSLDALADTKISVSTLTRLLNALIMNSASKDDCEGLPFSSSNLFTDTELLQAIKDIGYHPTLKDWYSVATDSSGTLKLKVVRFYRVVYTF